MIRNYDDFVQALLKAGFSQFGVKRDVVVSLIPTWDCEAPPDSIRWFCGDPDRDPWSWRMRALEHDEIAYAKVFFRKNGFITREWYPYFLAARRGGRSFADAYADGLMSRQAKRVYEALRDNGPLPAHALQPVIGFGKDEKSAYERAVVELEMGLYITLCGEAQKVSRAGDSYGWASNMLCAVEGFWPAEVFEQAETLAPEDAAEAIYAQVMKINPDAAPKLINKFIQGR